MKKVRVSLIGSGFVGSKHAAAYAKQPEAKLQVVCDVNEDSAIKLAEQYGFERIETDWRKAVAANDVDMVCICVPNNAHYEVASEAIIYGKHISCEKPLGISGGESEALALLAKENNIIASCCYNLVHIPAIRYVKKIIESGRLGNFVCFRGVYDTDRLVCPDSPFEWRMLKQNARGGSLCDLAINVLSISQYLFGDIRSISGMTKIIHTQRTDQLGCLRKVENDDIAQFIFAYQNGAIGYVSSNRVAPGSKQDMRFEAQFTLGAIRFSLERMNEIQIYRSGEEGFASIISDKHGWFHAGYEDLKAFDAHSFLKKIIAGDEPDTDFFFATKIDRVIECVLESTETRQWVDV